MDLLKMIEDNQIEKTGHKKKIIVPGISSDSWDIYKIPLDLLYYNDKNGRVITAYQKYKAEHGPLEPVPGKSEYNEIFQKFTFDSNPSALKNTLRSIKEKTQQEPGVVLPDGRVIDGNRRFTALRMIESDDNIPQYFEAAVFPLYTDSVNDEKKIKELELDLQIAREEKVSYDPIDRIFDIYDTIKIKKLMTPEEYKKYSGAKNTKGINRDIRLAELVLKFIEIISPKGDPVDKFYLARELKIDGPIEEIEGTINKLKDKDKETLTDAVLTYLAVIKTSDENVEPTKEIRDLKNYIFKNEDMKNDLIDAVDDKVDDIIDFFKDNPIENSNDLKKAVQDSEKFKNTVDEMETAVKNLTYKGKEYEERRGALSDLHVILDSLSEISSDDFKELNSEEYTEAKDILQEITDNIDKLKRGLN